MIFYISRFYRMAKSGTNDTSGTNDSVLRGNTRPLTRKKTSMKRVRGRKWCLTLNNYEEEEMAQIHKALEGWMSKWIIGEEVGESGTPHLQIYFQVKNPISCSSIKKLNDRLHIEKAKGNLKQNYEYCKKEGKYKTNINEVDFLSPQEREDLLILEEEYKGVKWKNFQKEVLSRVGGKVNGRKIYWYYEEVGNVGKSFVSKFLSIKFKEGLICGNGKMADIFNQVNSNIAKGIFPKIILVDIPRDSINYFNYGAMEKLKDGFFYSGKYEGGICRFRKPHIIIFSNDEPEYSKMSDDRYVVRKL